MLSNKSSVRFVLLTTTSIIGGIFAGEITAQAATFSNSETSLSIDEFSILPQDPDGDSFRDAIAFTGNDDSVANANGDGTLAFVIEENDASLDLDFTSDASGDGSNYFGLGQSDSFASSIFFVDSNETLSFDFAVSLALENSVNSDLDGSVNTFSGVSFALFDDLNDTFLGELRAIGNLDTNLADGIDNDTIFATSNLNPAIDSFDDEQIFGGNQEFASLDVTGSIQQTFTEPTQVRLQANTFNVSCTQAPQTSNPCVRTAVPESNNIVGLILGFIGIGLFYRKRN
ncbi:conserved hypothetical protein [Hyella patelloides LEGE 07179]|uniref:PEP-CTERM sorting domain-containing protein n=1 Tax=Hyella patelloides LEGE 07179 TaxID=945734 RepID=A0A563VZW6_9CYAN|nr:hypothetical protein [Hyella patelloides]VEP16981.1 conserved hypothetical protein [Hyella patelloides LEGE 07179]